MNGDNNKRGLDMFQFQMDGNVIVSNVRCLYVSPIVFHLQIKIYLIFNHCDHIGK
jgi:hypothetical protein